MEAYGATLEPQIADMLARQTEENADRNRIPPESNDASTRQIKNIIKRIQRKVGPTTEFKLPPTMAT